MKASTSPVAVAILPPPATQARPCSARARWPQVFRCAGAQVSRCSQVVLRCPGGLRCSGGLRWPQVVLRCSQVASDTQVPRWSQVASGGLRCAGALRWPQVLRCAGALRWSSGAQVCRCSQVASGGLRCEEAPGGLRCSSGLRWPQVYHGPAAKQLNIRLSAVFLVTTDLPLRPGSRDPFMTICVFNIQSTLFYSSTRIVLPSCPPALG